MQKIFASIMMFFFLFLSLSFFIVFEGEHGIVMRFNDFLRDDLGNIKVYNSGLHFKLPWFDNFYKLDMFLNANNIESFCFFKILNKCVFLNFDLKYRNYNNNRYILNNTEKRSDIFFYIQKKINNMFFFKNVHKKSKFFLNFHNSYSSFKRFLNFYINFIYKRYYINNSKCFLERRKVINHFLLNKERLNKMHIFSNLGIKIVNMKLNNPILLKNEDSFLFSSKKNSVEKEIKKFLLFSKKNKYAFKEITDDYFKKMYFFILKNTLNFKYFFNKKIKEYLHFLFI